MRRFEVVSIALDAQLRDKIDVAASNADISRSEWLRWAAARLLDDTKKFPNKKPA